MRYPSDELIKLGDTVLLEGGVQGVIVAVICGSSYAHPYTAEAWSYLEKGVLVEAGDVGPTHYLAARPEWKLLSRKLGR